MWGEQVRTSSVRLSLEVKGFTSWAKKVGTPLLSPTLMSSFVTRASSSVLEVMNIAQPLREAGRIWRA